MHAGQFWSGVSSRCRMSAWVKIYGKCVPHTIEKERPLDDNLASCSNLLPYRSVQMLQKASWPGRSERIWECAVEKISETQRSLSVLIRISRSHGQSELVSKFVFSVLLFIHSNVSFSGITYDCICKSQSTCCIYIYYVEFLSFPQYYITLC